jgi:hypothetical protein
MTSLQGVTFSDPWGLPAKIAIRCNILNTISANPKDRDEKQTEPLRSKYGTTGFASITRAVKHTFDAVKRNVVTSGDRCRGVNTRLAEAGVSDVISALGRTKDPRFVAELS